MAHRWLIVGTCTIVVITIVRSSERLGSNFTPVEDESRFQVSLPFRSGSSLAATQSLVDRVSRDILQQLPGVLAVQGNVGLTGGGQGATTRATSSSG